MKLRKYMAMGIFFLILFITTFSFAQNLSKDIIGKWEVKKFQNDDDKPGLEGGTLEFITDGTLLSEGVFFGIKKNTFKADGSVLTIRSEDGTTEWLATIKNDVLRLKGKRKNAINEGVFITLKRSVVTDVSMKNGL